MSLINFDKLEKIVKEEESEVVISKFKSSIDKLYEEENISEVFNLCHLFLNKYNDEFTSKELIAKINYELVKSCNLLIISGLNSNTDISALKPYIEACEKTDINDFDLYLTTINNKCCYLSRMTFTRNSIEIMHGLRSIYTLKLLSEMYGNSTGLETANYANTANCMLQLCAFYSQVKEHFESEISGLQALALNQLTIVHKIIHQKCSVKSEPADLSDKSNYDQSSSMSIILSYYNIGVQQEYLKRVKIILNYLSS